MYIESTPQAVEYLKSKDKRFCEAIEKIGYLRRECDSDMFSSVIHHIIGQQISTAAQRTIWKRLCDKLGSVNVDTVFGATLEDIQSVGITFKKAGYIKEFVEKIKSGEFDIEKLWEMSDKEVVASLSALDGIGVWTAEMIMTFCMKRPDVVSYGDLAIIRGMRMLYHHRKITKELFSKYSARYSPYGTVASLYLWAIAGGAIPEMRDYAPKKRK